MLYVRETLNLELLRLLLDHLSAQHSTGDETLERGGGDEETAGSSSQLQLVGV